LLPLRCMKKVWVVAIILGNAHLVHAGKYGTDEQAMACEKEYVANESWRKEPDAISTDLKHGAAISAACKAEVDKRAKSCLTDPENQQAIKDPAYGIAHSDPPAWCQYMAFFDMADGIEKALDKRAKDAAEAEAAAAEKAKLEATEVPKPEMNNRALEKAVTLAYQKDYSGKVLKVVLFGWADDLEKDGFGRVTGRDLAATVVNKQPDGKCQLHYELWLQYGNGRSFSGPLSARGAGSAEDSEILCSKVEAGAAPAKKKGK
jgi:hypothetical protein